MPTSGARTRDLARVKGDEEWADSGVLAGAPASPLELAEAREEALSGFPVSGRCRAC